MDRSVVVTGFGVVTPFGRGAGPIRSYIFEGRHGFKEITSFSTELSYAKRGGESNEAIRTFRAFSEYCMDEALGMAGLCRKNDRDILEKAVVAVGNVGEGGRLQQFYSACYGKKTKGMDADELNAEDRAFIHERHPFQAAEHAAAYIGSHASRIAFSNACVASANAIGYGFDQIRKGRADCAVVGGIQILNPFVFYNFDSSRAMSDDVVRPFSKNRNGLLISDGAAFLILESQKQACLRQAKPIAELLGWGISSDGFHVSQPEPQGSGLARAMRSALHKAGLSPESIDYINAHGTGTPLNDRSETRAIKQVFGADACRIPVSSTKSTTGHMLEATGAVEAVISIIALMDQRIPPTANYGEADPELDLDYVTEGPRSARLHLVMSNSSAFGGNNCSLIFGRGDAG